MTKEVLKFTVDSAILSELGERLVERSYIALAELVKNAYDADATEVNLTFSPDTDDHDGRWKIVISDNGTGMTFKDIENFWMRIGTTHKLEDATTKQFGRKKTGAKGIGRFCCRRLGSCLRLNTVAKLPSSEYESTKFTFVWTDYAPSGDLTKIECKGERSKLTSPPKSGVGTTLTITGCDRNEWQNPRTWKALKRQLAILVANRGASRKGFEADPGFNIFLESPENDGTLLKEKIEDLRENFMDAGWGRLGISIDPGGKVTYRLKGKDMSPEVLRLEKKYPDLAGTTADIAIYVIKTIADNRNPDCVKIGDLRNLIKDWGGINIRYQGARVPPYGDRQNDWLGIDRDRGRRLGKPENDEIIGVALELANRGGCPVRDALLNMLAGESYLGDVQLESPKPGLFQIKSSREGFLEDVQEGLEQLRAVVRMGIDWVTIWRDYSVRVGKKQRTAKALKNLEVVKEKRVIPQKAVEEAADAIKVQVASIAKKLPEEDQENLKKVVEIATDVISKQNDQTQDELRRLRLVASASSLMLIFSHEVGALLGDLDSYISRLRLLEAKLEKSDQTLLNEVITDIRDSKVRFSDLREMTSLIAIKSHTAIADKLNVATRLDRALKCFDLILKKYNINVSLALSSKKTGKMLEAELYIILLNAISNAIKSVIAAHRRERLIEIASEPLGTGLRLNIRDNGIGVSPNKSQRLFEPFISDPDKTLYTALEKHIDGEDSVIVGTGSGLGLNIVKEIVKKRNGSVSFVQPFAPWKADLEIVLK